MDVSPFQAMYLIPRRGFIYTISADVYAFLFAFSSVLACV